MIRTPIVLVLACVLGCASLLAAQQPSFRASVDLIAVDTQVVSTDGDPIADLGPDDFIVTVDGERRRVVSADLHQYAIGAARQGAAPTGDEPFVSVGAPRIFIVAVDATSFYPGAAAPAMEAAQAFVASLPRQDYVGLYTYPDGPQIVPTLERVPVRQGLATIVGSRMPFSGQFNLRPSEVVDITAMAGERPGSLSGRAVAALQGVPIAEYDPVRAVQYRECPDDAECATRIVSETRAFALHLEAQAQRSLGGLAHLLRVVEGLPGRKYIVLITGGVLVSDRPGGRPDVGQLATTMGQTAARSNAVLYTVHIDGSFSGLYSAAGRRTGETERGRDRGMVGDWLDRFSATAGGARFHVPVGAGEFAFERVLRETSAMYLLGVEASDEDRDGRPRQLKVRLARSAPKDASVRHRQWVVVDDRP